MRWILKITCNIMQSKELSRDKDPTNSIQFEPSKKELEMQGDKEWRPCKTAVLLPILGCSKAPGRLERLVDGSTYAVGMKKCLLVSNISIAGQQQPDCSKPTNSKTVFKTPGPDCFTLRPRPTQARHQWWCSLDQTNEWMSGYIIYNIDCLVLGRLVACLVDWLCLRSCCARKKIINLMRAGPKEPPQSLLFW